MKNFTKKFTSQNLIGFSLSMNSDNLKYLDNPDAP